jgi:hypothetical protein
MKFAKLIAAAALAVAGIAGTSTAASAAPVSHVTTLAASAASAAGFQDRRYYRDDRRGYRDDRRRWDRRHGNRGRYYNRGRNQRVCWQEWRRHQGRVTVCRRR